jgi:hypothetical protein
MAQYKVYCRPRNLVDHKKKKAEKENGNDDYQGCARYFPPAGPGNIVQFLTSVLQKLYGAFEGVFELQQKFVHLLSSMNIEPADERLSSTSPLNQN